ncbi:hypothetical protein D3C81_832480 [compost metagenome]
MHGAELRDADRQIPVAVHAALVDHHVMRTVHRTQHELLGVDRHLREHVFLVMIPVAGGLVQIHVAENRRIYMLIAKAGFDVNDITFQYAAQLGALRQPDRQALADELVECEDFKLLAELAVVALLRFLQQMQVLVQLRFLDPGGAVHALQHLVLAVAAPVRAGHIHQLEHLDFAGRRNMRSTAQIEEFALLVNGDDAVLGQVPDQFKLVGIAKLAEDVQRFLTADFLADNRQIFGNDAFHFLLDLLEILRIQRLLQVHIIIKSVFNRRADAQLHFFGPIQALDGLCHQVGCAVTHNLQAFRGIQRYDFNKISFIQLGRQIDDYTVQFACGCVLSQPAADGSRHIVDAAAFRVLTNRSVR